MLADIIYYVEDKTIFLFKILLEIKTVDLRFLNVYRLKCLNIISIQTTFFKSFDSK